ncbi:hypothetical protein WN990_33065 [Kitasatospora purpeofusca]
MGRLDRLGVVDTRSGATLTVGPDGHTFYVTGTNYNDNPGTFLQIVSL